MARKNLSGLDTTVAQLTAGATLLSRIDTANEGGQIDFARSSDNATAWSIDVYGNTTTPALRFIQGGTTVALSINSARQLASANLLSPNLIAATETTQITGAAFATGANNVDALTASVWYYNVNATASGSINFRGNSTTTLSSLLAVGQSLTFAVIIQNGATAFYPASYTIDGAAVTPKWSGGTAPTAGNASANDVYSYTITKTAATPTYVVWATQTKFGL